MGGIIHSTELTRRVMSWFTGFFEVYGQNGIENIGDWAWTGISSDAGGRAPLPDSGGIWNEQPPVDLGGGGSIAGGVRRR